MNRFDVLLATCPEFKSHLRSRLLVSYKETLAILRPGLSRKERVGIFVNCLRQNGCVSQPTRMCGHFDRHDREFPGAPNTHIGSMNPHVEAKALERELRDTATWIEPCLLRDDPLNQGNEMETLTRRIVHDVPDERSATSLFEANTILDSLRWCLEDAAKLAQSAVVESARFQNEQEQAEKDALQAVLG